MSQTLTCLGLGFGLSIGATLAHAAIFRPWRGALGGRSLVGLTLKPSAISGIIASARQTTCTPMTELLEVCAALAMILLTTVGGGALVAGSYGAAIAALGGSPLLAIGIKDLAASIIEFRSLGVPQPKSE